MSGDEMRYLVVIALVLGLGGFSCGSAVAADGWNFMMHPQPGDADLSAEESRRLDDAFAKDWPESCPARVEVAYEIYNQRYPAFSRSIAADQAFSLWADYVVSIGANTTSMCIINQLAQGIIGLDRGHGPFVNFFCGKPVTDPKNDDERYLAALFAKLTAYAELNSYNAVFELTALEFLQDMVRLNPDIRYFLERFVAFEELRPMSPALITTLGEAMGAERLAFVEEAFKHRDLASVIETSPACKPWVTDAEVTDL
ncbi:hypothetical protein FJU08_19050 [Martelella alba]|uniref:Uncharacterized protein n=1 Tax=Martelella alba TaxID=2590451 RepID=A0A506U2W6_9HYPH|nr:hypothetical protein [Martelella alba]TPW27828.1 hypothetical protein FJU08_19050 [Martelella alba]